MSTHPASPEDGEEGAAGAHLTVDLGALVANWRRLGAEARGAECAAVIKADAYGCGIEGVAPALVGAGCRTLFVAHPGEGARARAACPDAAIYVLNGLMPGAAPIFARDDLRPVLGSREEVAEWAAFNRGQGVARACALHVDTGMNRTGLPVAEALALAGDPDRRGAAPALLMSHLVSAEAPGDPANAAQVEAFAAVRAAFPDLPASLANSSGIFLRERPHHAMVRPGYALYGGNPTPERANPMRPVVGLAARIVQVREVEAGAHAGYGGLWTAPGPRRLATLSVGYADGYRRAGSGTDAKAGEGVPAGAVLIGGALCPVAGIVSMDLLIVDATEAPRADVARGAPAILIGGGLDLAEVGRRAGTIGYEVLTSLGRRFARTYIGA